MRRLWRSISGFLILLTFIFLTYSPPVQASTEIKVTIDGKPRTFETPVQIASDRVMVPIRFVIEDEALQGKVYWDGKLRKVAIDCRGKYIELFIGSLKATVDGETVWFDSAPYISDSRTFIPLRFLAESLGATVGWENQTREVNIDFSNKLVVMPYYYAQGGTEFNNNAELFSDVAFRWFETNAQGELNYEYKDDYSGMMELARSRGLKTQASVVLMDKKALHELLFSEKNRSRLLGNIMERVENDGYDGVNIDFELMAASDGYLLTTFLRELKAAMGEHTLSVAVYARTSGDYLPTPYEYAKIGQIVDQVVVMAYDYHNNTSAPGPVAPLWWDEQVVDYMCSQIPAEKILLGIATYGYDWPAGKYGSNATVQNLAVLKQRYTLVGGFDEGSMSPHYSYWDENGVLHQIWLENEQSLRAKVNLAKAKNLGGISFWRIGTGCEDLFKVLAEN